MPTAAELLVKFAAELREKVPEFPASLLGWVIVRLQDGRTFESGRDRHRACRRPRREDRRVLQP